MGSELGDTLDVNDVGRGINNLDKDRSEEDDNDGTKRNYKSDGGKSEDEEGSNHAATKTSGKEIENLIPNLATH